VIFGSVLIERDIGTGIATSLAYELSRMGKYGVFGGIKAMLDR
jgi:hypothetical protein